MTCIWRRPFHNFGPRVAIVYRKPDTNDPSFERWVKQLQHEHYTINYYMGDICNSIIMNDWEYVWEEKLSVLGDDWEKVL